MPLPYTRIDLAVMPRADRISHFSVGFECYVLVYLQLEAVTGIILFEQVRSNFLCEHLGFQSMFCPIHALTVALT